MHIAPAKEETKTKRPQYSSCTILPGNSHAKFRALQRSVVFTRRCTEFLRIFNIFLIGAIVILACTLLFDPPTYLEADITQESLRIPIGETPPAKIKIVKPLSYYTDPLESRNIFQPRDHQEKVLAQLKEEAIKGLKTKLRILGIILDKNPQVIIEKMYNGEVVFLSKGDTIDSAHIVEIFEDKVIFDYKEVNVELTR